MQCQINNSKSSLVISLQRCQEIQYIDKPEQTDAAANLCAQTRASASPFATLPRSPLPCFQQLYTRREHGAECLRAPREGEPPSVPSPRPPRAHPGPLLPHSRRVISNYEYFRLANLNGHDSDSEAGGLSVLAAVEKEMCRSSRNIGCRFSPKLARPANPLGKLFDSGLDQFSISTTKHCCGKLGTTTSSLSTEGSLRE